MFIRVHLWFLALAAAGCTEQTSPIWSVSGPTMGTRYNVSLVGGDEARAERVRGLIDEALADLCRQMSTYDPGSELSRFNAGEPDEWFSVSDQTASVVATALELARSTGGKYDPTIGPLANLWGFGPNGKRDEPPTDDEIAAAMDNVGHELLEARLDPPALRKRRPGVFVELSSIAPGHGADVVAELLTREGFEAFMVEIGGEVRARGLKPGGRPWRIGVEKADAPVASGGKPGALQRVVELRDKSLATSGDYRNFFESEGVRYSHTIDPQTGRPVAHDLATVTVVADRCRDADALATALLALGPDAGYDWAVEHDVAALMVRRTAGDEVVERLTPAWTQLGLEASP